MWRALRTINSKHESWTHLPANRSDQQDSQLRVDNTTAQQAKAGAEPQREPVKSQLSNGYSEQENQDPGAKNMANGVHVDGSEAGSKAVGKTNGFVPNEPNPFEGKVPKAGQLKEDESGSGEIKAHNEPVNGKQSMAVL